MKILIEIDLDNDAFWISEEERDLKEAQRILSDVGNMIDSHAYFGSGRMYEAIEIMKNKNLQDINGNTVGSFKLVDDQGRVLS
mgnify:FL=1